MAKFYNKVRSGATMREKIELLLESNPYTIAREAPAIGIIEDEEELSKPWPKGSVEPLIYNHNNLSEVSEFFAIYLEIFLHDHGLNTESRKAKAEERFHEKITELEELVEIFEERFSQPSTNEATLKAVAKENLNEVIHSLAKWEKELAELGRNVFHSVKNDPREVAFFIVKKLAALRREAERRGSIGAKTAEERVLRILDYSRPDYFHQRFFQVFLGFKCEELKGRIDNYKKPPMKDTTSMAETAPECPLSEEFFDWFRAQEKKVSMNVFIVACWSVNWNPLKNCVLEKFSESEKEHEENELRRKLNRDALHELENCIDHALNNPERINTHKELGDRLIRGPEPARVKAIIKKLVCSPLNEAAKAKLEALRSD